MNKTTFKISTMDCPAEERMIRMSLDDAPNITELSFDLGSRQLDVFHTGDPDVIFQKLDSLSMGAMMIGSEESEFLKVEDHGNERRVLMTVLLINLSFFFLNVITGLIAGSMGLIADGLDMLADCLVFALSLFAVGGTISRKKNVAKASGYFQLVLAVLGLSEVIRRFLGFGEVPEYKLMIIVSSLALIGNATSIYILSKARREEAHMQASYIFLSNDVVINFGVILAGVFVYFTTSQYPDLIIGSLIFLVVARGAFTILRLAR